jgi:phage terminase small subunit
MAREKPAQSKRRAEHHADLLMGLAKQRIREASLAEHYAKEIGDIDAYSLAEFCRRHSIWLQMYYKLAQQGLAPATFKAGARVLISKEAAARWRAEREADSAADWKATGADT